MFESGGAAAGRDYLGYGFPFRYLYYQHQSLISTGNAATLLINGEAIFPALFKALKNACSPIHLEYYIFTADDVGIYCYGISLHTKKPPNAAQFIRSKLDHLRTGDCAK